MTDYNDGKWHGWNGGECPVHPETVVEVLTTYPGKNDGFAGSFTWGDQDRFGHWIVAFRVVTPYRGPREIIIGGVTYREVIGNE